MNSADCSVVWGGGSRDGLVTPWFLEGSGSLRPSAQLPSAVGFLSVDLLLHDDRMAATAPDITSDSSRE